jgi:hypothetical protein
MTNQIALTNPAGTQNPPQPGSEFIQSLELLGLYEKRVRHLWQKLFEARGQAKEAARVHYQDAYVAYKRQQAFVHAMSGRG